MESFWEKAVQNVLNAFGISFLYDEQIDVVSKFFSNKQDVFVNLPTSFAKTLLYQATHHGKCSHWKEQRNKLRFGYFSFEGLNGRPS